MLRILPTASMETAQECYRQDYGKEVLLGLRYTPENYVLVKQPSLKTSLLEKLAWKGYKKLLTQCLALYHVFSVGPKLFESLKSI